MMIDNGEIGLQAQMPEMDNDPRPIEIEDKELLEVWTQRIIQAVEDADGDLQGFRDEVAKGRELVQNTIRRIRKPYPNATEAHPPRCKSTINHLAARIVNGLCGSDTYVKVEAQNPYDSDFATAAEKFSQIQQDKQIQVKPKLFKIIKACLRDGASVVYVKWRRREQKRKFWQNIIQPVKNADGSIGAVPKPVGIEKLVRTYDGPDYEIVPIDNFGFWPASSGDIQESSIVYVKVSMTGNDLLQGVKEGDYDEDVVNELRARGGGETSHLETPSESGRGSNPSATSGQPFHLKTYDMIVAYVNFSESEDEPGSDWLFTIEKGSGKTLQAIPNPWWYGGRPIVLYVPFQDPEGVLGDSIPGLQGALQDAEMRLLRSSVDAAEYGSNPVKFVHEGAIDPDKEKDLMEELWPGGVFPLNIPPKDALMLSSIALAAQTVVPVLDILRLWNERVAPVTDTRMGLPGPHAQTKYEVSEQLGEGDILLTIIIDSLGIPFAKMIEICLHMSYQFAGSPMIQQLWNMAVGPPMPGQMPMSIQDALSKTYTIQAAGSLEASNKGVKRQRILQLLPLLLQEPLIAGNPLHKYDLWKLVLTEFGIVRTPETLLGNEQEAQAELDRQMLLTGLLQDYQTASAENANAQNQQVADRDFQMKQKQYELAIREQDRKDFETAGKVRAMIESKL